MAVTSVTEAGPRVSLRGVLLGRVVPIIAFLLLGAVVLGVGAALAFDRTYAGRVLPGVSVGGIDISGLTAEQLRERLAQVPVLPETVEVISGNRRVTVPAGELGGRVDIEGAVGAALAAGRTSGSPADLLDRLVLWRDGREVALRPTVDRTVLRAWVAERAEQLWFAPRNVAINRTRRGWSTVSALDGRALDTTTSFVRIEGALLAGPNPTATAEAPVRTVTPEVDDIDAMLAISRADRMTQPVDLTFRGGRKWTLSPATLRAAISFAPDGRLTPVIDDAVIAAAVAPIDKKVSRPAKEVVFLKTKSGRIFGFVPGAGGRSLDVEATTGQVRAILDNRLNGASPGPSSMRIVTSNLSPKLSADQAAKSATQMTLVGSWTTRFHPSERNANGANIRLPARFINGTVVAPGAVFDFWAAVGPVTFGRGFGMGGIIESGRTNPTGAIGGGICSASTTLFNAAARAGYEILERDNHAYYINRYPLGLDATVSKFGGRSVQNMRFRNDTATPLFIRGLSGGGWVRFEIYSLPTGRTVTFSKPAVSNVRPAIDTSVRTSALKKGQTERLETPTAGKDVFVTRTVRDASGRVVHTDRWFSHYIRVDGILRIGIG
jgi:vancomycin resistance protein YoaR